MSWFNKPDYWRTDPDERQDRTNGKCVIRPMTQEEREKYGPESDKKN